MAQAEKWRKHQDTLYWVYIELVQRKGIKFYQTRSNASIFHETLPGYCIPKVVRMESGRSHIRESMCVTSSYSKDLIEARMDKKIGFGSCSTTRRRSCSTSRIFPTNSKSIEFVTDRGDLMTRKKHVPFPRDQC